MRMFGIAAGVYIVLTTVCFAQGINTAGIDVTPVLDQVLSVTVVVLTGVVGLISKFVINWLAAKVHVEDQQFKQLAADRVNQILYAAIAHAEVVAKREINDPNSGLKDLRIDNFFISTAVSYAVNVMSGKGGLSELFGFTPEGIRDRILTRLNERINIVVPKEGKSKELTIS